MYQPACLCERVLTIVYSIGRCYRRVLAHLLCGMLCVNSLHRPAERGNLHTCERLPYGVRELESPS